MCVCMYVMYVMYVMCVMYVMYVMYVMCESDDPSDICVVIDFVWLMTKRSKLQHCTFSMDVCSLVGLEPKGQHCIDPLWLES